MTILSVQFSDLRNVSGFLLFSFLCRFVPTYYCLWVIGIAKIRPSILGSVRSLFLEMVTKTHVFMGEEKRFVKHQ